MSRVFSRLSFHFCTLLLLSLLLLYSYSYMHSIPFKVDMSHHVLVQHYSYIPRSDAGAGNHLLRPAKPGPPLDTTGALLYTGGLPAGGLLCAGWGWD